MADRFELDFSEAEARLLSRMMSVSSQVEEEVDAILARGADEIWARARTNAPVDTGNLRRKIIVKRVGASHYKILSEAEYSKAVEYGTFKTPPQPFMRPAWNDLLPSIRTSLKGVIQRGMRR